ncbi:MAG: FAD-dependent oxidoreductase [Desulfobacterales bacterium]|nr:FAD-dependent oxidoreductase [Desulfobacterales bacterium]
MTLQEERLKTDVLVIGGGLAGCFAAMKAAEQGAGVTLVEKGHVAHSGANTTGIDHFPYCFIPQVHGRLGHTIEDFVRNQTLVGVGLVDQDLCEMMWQDSYERLCDLERIGIKIRFDKIYPWNFGYEPGDYPDDPKLRIVPWNGYRVPAALNIEGRLIKKKLYERLRQLKVRTLHFHDFQQLLLADGAVTGALGFHIRTGQFSVVEARATVLATGFLSRIFPAANLFNHLVPPNQTAEGQIMALNAGAKLAIMEHFRRVNTRVEIGRARLKNWVRSSPATPSGYPAGRVVNSAGEVMPSQGRDFDQLMDAQAGIQQAEWVRTSIREGKTPFYWDATAATPEERDYANWSSAEEGGGIELYRHIEEDLQADLSTHQIELAKPKVFDSDKPMGFLMTSPSGIVINTRCETSLPGLYAAGEAAYGQHFPSSPWAFATGARAGTSAAQQATGGPAPAVDSARVNQGRDALFAPLGAGQGVSWQEMNRAVGSLMGGYFLGASTYAKNVGLARLEELKQERLRAANAHELMRCRETLSLITVAEVFLRASLFPRKADEWRIIEKSGDGLCLSTRPIRYKFPVAIPDAGKAKNRGE